MSDVNIAFCKFDSYRTHFREVINDFKNYDRDFGRLHVGEIQLGLKYV